eukprot:m.160379 g.160379  ORF g.160379 m.160379 type:complete len:404 (+) comp13383_c5_seq1:58-1269(+)
MSGVRSVNKLCQGIYIMSAQRTACGAFGGSFKNVSATDLAVISSKAAIDKSGFSVDQIDTAIFGNVQQTSADASYLARHVALGAGMKIITPALTVNRLCGSGFESVIQGAQQILLGESDIALTGGTENMSQAPYAVRNIRFGTRLGMNPAMEDTLWEGLTDSYCNLPMGVTAENLAEQYDISREDADNFALSSQQKWAKANEKNVFDDEITPVTVKVKGKAVDIVTDEHPRPSTTIEQLQKLPTVFKKNGAVTAGSSSGICDGAASLVVASEDAMKESGSKPLCKIVGWATAGVDPSVMGIGPVPAIEALLEKAGLTVDDIDLFEVNEAFGTQCLSVAKALSIPHDILNVHGGAIALGHPLGMSGSRILTHLSHCISRGEAQYAVGSACIGGGQGIAVLLQAV